MEKVKFVTLLLAINLFIFFLLACSDNLKIDGEVLSLTGEPLHDALVSVDGINIKTDDKGKYNFSPKNRKFKILFSKEGYLPLTEDIQIPEGQSVYKVKSVKLKLTAKNRLMGKWQITEESSNKYNAFKASGGRILLDALYTNMFVGHGINLLNQL